MAGTGFKEDFKRNFFTGIAALFPILITVFLFSWLYWQISGVIGPLCWTFLAHSPAVLKLFAGEQAVNEAVTVAARRQLAQQTFPGILGVLLGLFVVSLLIYLTGRVLRGYLGRRAIRAVDRFFERFPVIKAVYPYARQVGDFLFGQRDRRRFSRVVAIEYPRQGVYSVGFLTGEGLKAIERSAGRRLVTVFIPTSPTPLTGFIVSVPAEEVIHLEMTVDEAFRYCITAGMLTSGSGQQRRVGVVAPPADPPGADGVSPTARGGQGQQ